MTSHIQTVLTLRFMPYFYLYTVYVYHAHADHVYPVKLYCCDFCYIRPVWPTGSFLLSFLLSFHSPFSVCLHMEEMRYVLWFEVNPFCCVCGSTWNKICLHVFKSASGTCPAFYCLLFLSVSPNVLQSLFGRVFTQNKKEMESADTGDSFLKWCD